MIALITEEEWLARSQLHCDAKLFQVANMYMNKEFIQKLRDLGMLEQPIEPKGAALFSCNMDAIHAVEQSLLGFLGNLRTKGLFFTEQEFAKKALTQYYHKGNDVGRILGREYIKKDSTVSH